MNRIKLLLLTAIAVTIVAMLVTVFVLRTSGDAYANALPRDATALARLDAKSFLSAAKLDAKDLKLLWQRSRQNRGNEDVKPLGIDIKRPIYAFASATGNFGFLAAVSSAGNLQDFLEEEHAAGRASEVTRQRGYSWAVVQQQWLLAFDGKRALAMGPAVGTAQDQLRAEMARLLEQDKDNSGRESVLFTEMKKKDELLTAIVSPELLPGEARAYLRKIKVASRADALLRLSMETDDNELELQADILAQNDSMKAALKRIDKLLRPIKGAMIDHAHAENVAWLALNVQGSELLDILRSDATVRASLLILNFAFDLDRIIRSVDGDLAVELTHASALPLGKTDASQLQGLYVTAQVENTDFLKSATSWNSKLMGVQALSQTDFRMNLGESPIYFGVEDDIFYLGAHQGLPTEKNDYLLHERSDIKGNRFYATIAMPNLLKQLAVTAQLPASLRNFERLNIEMEDAGEFKLTLKAPEGTNIAKQLLLAE